MHFLYKMFRNHCLVISEANFTYMNIKKLELPADVNFDVVVTLLS